MAENPTAPSSLIKVPYRELFLDPQNPRLAGHHVDLEDQDEILEWLWKNKSVMELVNSIAANGYWDHEELFATDEEGRRVVVEGNRRRPPSRSCLSLLGASV